MNYRSPFTSAAFILFLFGLIIPLRAQHIPEAVDKEYHTALRLYQEGLYENAIEYFSRVAGQYPESSLDESARYHIALANARLDQDNADIYLEEFISHYPEGVRAIELYINRANEQYEEDEFGMALEYYERALEINRNRETAALLYYRMAEASVGLRDVDGASTYYLNLSENYPDSDLAPVALYARGRLYLSEEEYQAATDAFELLREQYPNHERTRRIGTALGESYYQQGRYAEAVTALQEALPHLRDEPREMAILLIAESYNYLNELQEATRYYRRYINRNEGEEDARLAHFGLGWVYHKQEVYHWAAQSFGNAVEGDDEISRKALYYKAINEKLSGRYDLAMRSFQDFGDRYRDGIWVETAYYEWAVTAFEMGNYVASLEVLLRLIRSDMELENTGDILTLLGEAYFANNEFTRAIQAFEEAARLGEVDRGVKRQALFQRAWVQFRNQAYSTAQPTFQELYEEEPRGEISGEALFWSADAHYNMNNWTRAAEQFEQFLQEFPGHEFSGAATYSLGWSYFNLEQFDRAVEPLTDFLESYDPPPIALFPYDIDTQLRIGDAWYALGEYENAITYYEEATGADPGGDYALFQIGNSHHRNETTFEAVSAFRRLIRIYPFSHLREQSQYNIGYIYFLSGNYSQAIEEFESLISRFSNSSWAARSQYNIGDAYYNAGAFEDAIEAYKQVLEDYPRSDYVIESISGIQFSQLANNQEDTSNEIMEEFLGNHPQSGTADRMRFLLAENKLRSGDYEEAVRELRNYLRVTNSDRYVAEAHFNIAEAYEHMGEPLSAISEYQLVLGNHSGSDYAHESLYSLGRLYYEIQEYQLAVNAYEALETRSSAMRIEALAGAGNAYLALGDADKAEEKFTEGLSRNPNHEDSQSGIGKVAVARQNFSEAERIFNEIATTSSDAAGAEAQYHLGLIHQLQNNYDAALRAYSNVRILFETYDDWVSKSLLRSAECHEAMGASNDAENMLRDLIERYPDTAAASEAAVLLSQR